MNRYQHGLKQLTEKLMLLSWLSIGLLSPMVMAESELATDFAKKGEKTCLKCHDEQPVTLIYHTPHAQKADARTPFASHECETCHGASPEHIETGDRKDRLPEPPAVVFGRKAKDYTPTQVAEQNKVCLACHESGKRMNWISSKHQFGDVPCASCHNIHSLKDPVLVKTSQAKVCFTCHMDKRSEINRRSRHPIREGKVVCSDCHNPHGSLGPSQLAKNTVNETCYQCHAEKRGPFLWEHQPVREECTLCHNPHGSTQPRMLKVRQPWLCQQCHSEAFHPSTLYSGDDIPPVGAAQQLLGKSCTNCHSKIHGSNHPSGSRFTR